MTQKFYSSLTSPYARKIRVALRETGLHTQIEEVLTDPFKPTEEFLVANPLCKIPAFETRSGEVLPDSNLILHYLAEQYPTLNDHEQAENPLLNLRLRQYAEGIIDASVATVLEKRRPEPIVYRQFLDRQSDTIERALIAIERDMDQLVSFGTTAITLAVALNYLNFRLPYIEWMPVHTEMAQWLSEVNERPSLAMTVPPQ